METQSSPESVEKKVTLARATLGDASQILEIEQSVGGLKTYSNLKTLEDAEKQVTESVTYLIKQGEEVVGNVSYVIKSPERVYIDGLVVMPQFSGQGLGKKAMKVMLEEIKDYKRIDLVTHPENAGAVKLYQSLGFEIESRVEDYFGDGEPRVVMVKK